MGALPHYVTQANFDGLSLHDDTIYGLRLDTVDPQRRCGAPILCLTSTTSSTRFRVAPATLAFHDVTDLVLAIDWGNSGHQTALHLMAIDSLAREAVANQKNLPRPALPPLDDLAELAEGRQHRLRRQRLHAHLARATPILSDEQQLSPLARDTQRAEQTNAIPELREHSSTQIPSGTTRNTPAPPQRFRQLSEGLATHSTLVARVPTNKILAPQPTSQ